ncbi:MAG TPA: LamG domain-containing protein [Polyangiaceae bacterium]|nr:LamG domain-containing protein [Polyangiaceae bacterium]
MSKQTRFLLFLLTAACEPRVVDAVREPPPPVEVPVETPPKNPLASSLLHRYSFNGLGNIAHDSIGAAPGPIVNASLTGTGSLTLAGQHSLEYVNLPNDIISGLNDATFEAWLTWGGGGGPWQRIFDFGNSGGGEDMPVVIPGTTSSTYSGTTYLFLTANAASDSNRGLEAGLRVAYSLKGVGDEDVCSGTESLPTGVPTHVAVVVDSKAQTIALYQDGALLNECQLSRPLSDIDDVNNWLGRSNFTADADLDASYDEFRIYTAALTAEQVADSFKFGPDAKPL